MLGSGIAFLDVSTGEFKVINRQTDKTWVVPASIQEEMRREGKIIHTLRAPEGERYGVLTAHAPGRAPGREITVEQAAAYALETAAPN